MLLQNAQNIVSLQTPQNQGTLLVTGNEHLILGQETDLANKTQLLLDKRLDFGVNLGAPQLDGRTRIP